MQLIDAQGEILRLRPNEFDNKYQYFVRLRPDIKMKKWSLARTGIKLRQKDEWVAVSAQVARVLSHYSETGRTFIAMRFHVYTRSRTLRPLVDIATCKEDADQIEKLYEIDRRQLMPGTTDQPHKMLQTASPTAKEGLANIERQLGLVRYDQRFVPAKFGPSMQARPVEDPEAASLAADLAALQESEAVRSAPKSPSRPSRPLRPVPDAEKANAPAAEKPDTGEK